MKRLVQMLVVACLLAGALVGVVGVIVPDACNVLPPWWPGCGKDDGAGGGSGGAG